MSSVHLKVPFTRAMLVVVAAAAIVVGGIVILTQVVRDAPDHRTTLVGSDSTNPTPAPPGPVVINLAKGEVFTPSSATKPTLSSSSVFQHFAALNGSSQLAPPPDVSVTLGRLTMPVGQGHQGQYVANDELVWSFSWGACPPSLTSSPPPTSGCTEWLFLDATDGHQVDQTWQQ